MPCVYHSREEVAAHWFQMLRDGEKGVRHASGEDVDVMYNTGNGWRSVTLADPEDSKALCALSEEFVRRRTQPCSPGSTNRSTTRPGASTSVCTPIWASARR
ncbi:unnamed protein product [Prorocentrum cordatum]|uniref:Uncharacterized protein n=1 Tax=Prorocentrum cordatum TaxID=2364126 RepID=A0ABN9PAJ9_9DINO|nr:unnamed protein product [Polarella glacialis]